MLEGSLEPHLANKWAWDRDRPDASLNPDYPRWEMEEFLDAERPAKL